MWRSANKLCARTHYERYVKWSWELNSRNWHHNQYHEAKKVKWQSICIKYVHHGTGFNFVYPILYTDVKHHNTNTKYVLCTAIIRKSHYADQKYSTMCYATPHYLSLLRTCHNHHDHYAQYCSPLAPFSHSKNSVANSAFGMTVRYSRESKPFPTMWYNLIKVLTSLRNKLTLMTCYSL